MSRELPEHELLRLKMAASGRSRTELILEPELSGEERARLDELVRRRMGGEPLQYLEGTVAFGPIALAVDERALIPRPETEELYELATALVTDPHVIVDLCTGSGNLALALKHEYPDAEVFGTDVSVEAVSLANQNSANLGLDVSNLRGNLFDPLPARLVGAVDLLVANPPYVATGDALPAEIVDYEPNVALYAGPRGLEIVERIASGFRDWLSPDGVLVCEIGLDQGHRVAALFGSGAEIRSDLTGRDRFLITRN